MEVKTEKTIEIKFYEDKTGERILNFCEETLKTPNLDSVIYHMLSTIKHQTNNLIK